MNIPPEQVELFCSPSEEASYLMQNLWLDVENSRLLATDGHMLVRVTVSLADGDCSGVIPVEVFQLARKELKAITKSLGKETIPHSWLRVTCHEENVQIENLLSNTQHFVQRKTPKEGQFPNVDAVFPKKLERPTITFTRDLLSILLNAIKGESVAVSLWLQGNDKGAMFACPTSEAVGMLMPCTDGEIQSHKVLARGGKKAKAVTP